MFPTDATSHIENGVLYGRNIEKSTGLSEMMRWRCEPSNSCPPNEKDKCAAGEQVQRALCLYLLAIYNLMV